MNEDEEDEDRVFKEFGIYKHNLEYYKTLEETLR